jgi:hypothetical protein
VSAASVEEISLDGFSNMVPQLIPPIRLGDHAFTSNSATKPPSAS